jgi:DNA-binding response OmpR family regulator
MPRILVFDQDVAHAEALAIELKRHNHSITACTTYEELRTELDNARPGFDIVILDVSHNRPEDWNTLDRIRRLR